MRVLIRNFSKVGVWCYSHLFGLYLTLVVYSNFALAYDYKYGTATAPLLDLMIIIMVLPLVLGNYRKWIPFIKTDYFIWCCLLTCIYLLNYYRLTNGGYSYSELDLTLETNRLQRVILWPCIGFAVYVLSVEHFRLGFKILLFTMPALVLLDFIDPSIMGAEGELANPRADGSYINPNLAGEAIILLLLMNLYRFKGFFGIAAILLATVAIGVTFSRSGIAALILVFGYLYVRGKVPKIAIVLPVILAISYSAILVFVEDSLLYLGYESNISGVLDRLRFFESIETENITVEQSGESRTLVAGWVLSDALNKPFLGYVFDPFSIYEMNPHNQPLFLWYKFGVTGLIGWLFMLFMLFRPAYKRSKVLLNPLLFGFFWFSFFSHNLFEMKFWIVAIAFMTLKDFEKWHGEIEFLGVKNKTFRKLSVNSLSNESRMDMSSKRPRTSRRRKTRSRIRF